MSNAATPGKTLWRIFPWNQEARPGDPFTPDYLPPEQGAGRFDIPQYSLVRYLAESPDHAVGEMIQGFRGRKLLPVGLLRAGYPLALVSIQCGKSVIDRIVDCCDPKVLQKHNVRPDMLASRDRDVTRGIARRFYEAGAAGLRWWSAFSGDWHTVVLFESAVDPKELQMGTPEILTVNTPVVQHAAQILDVELVERASP